MQSSLYPATDCTSWLARWTIAGVQNKTDRTLQLQLTEYSACCKDPYAGMAIVELGINFLDDAAATHPQMRFKSLRETLQSVQDGIRERWGGMAAHLEDAVESPEAAEPDHGVSKAEADVDDGCAHEAPAQQEGGGGAGPQHATHKLAEARRQWGRWRSWCPLG